ncbi:glycosyltransferase involved in cell wall biosynthesis [Actinomycetospora cinnamomea]|uniref:Glycosyltransferase involved in cell wall biosynthesis n=1 Tax=Actinomycetospora cinnamomea TaxID=663609 RepID=A0A2U1F725_9PSEU|nr:glycosyltransferase involved in cell wall biosynthesis [Actinomycetospora cinnamomea]
MLFVVPNLLFGGAERHVATLLPAMDRDRFEPSVVCLNEGGHLFGELVEHDVPALDLRRAKREVPATLVDLVRHMRRTRPDVVICRGFTAEALGRLAGVLARVPARVVWMHNCGDIRPRSRVHRLVERLLRPVTTAVYGVAHTQVPYLVDDLGYDAGRVRIIHNGVVLGEVEPAGGEDGTDEEARDEARAEFGIAPDEPLIGSVAMLREEKGHETLLQAFRLLLADEPRARLLLVGDGPLRDVLHTRAAALGVAERVVFAGNRSDVPRLLRAMDVFTLCSRTECFPMSVLEAMAASRPVVCTAVGGIPEIVVDGETGTLVPPGEPRALADAFLDLLRDPTRGAQLGKAGRSRVEQEFTLDRSVRTAEDVIAATAGRRPAPERARPDGAAALAPHHGR